MTHAKPLGLLCAALTAGMTLAVPASAAKPDKCEQAISRASGAYLAKYVGVVRRCEKLRLQGILPAGTDCVEDSPMAAELEGIRVDLETAIGKACGGADKTCGSGGDDPTPAEFGWGAVEQCPDLDRSGCTNTITTCADVTTCIACTGAAASKQLAELTFGEFDSAAFGTKSDANECQLAIGRATTKFLQVSARALSKCWIARIRGKDDGECPDGDGKDDEMIDKAEAKKQKVICKACGGADAQCGGSDDLAVADFGFASACPDVTVPSGGSCGGAIVDLPDVVDCVDCVARFKAECMAGLGAPGRGPYPAECNPGGGSTTTTTTTPGSTTTTVGGLCGNGVLDPGEQCDPAASPGGAFSCAPGTTCSAQCVCAGASTTTCSSTTLIATTTTTTSTTAGGTCGNGVLDPGEECDMSSPAGSLVCPPGCTCDSLTCDCVPIGGSTTTTTVAAGCGNGVVDPGEECDASSPSGSFACAVGETCGAGCTCVGPTTSSSTTVPAATTTSTPTGTTSPVTTTTQPTGGASFLDFTTGQSDEACGAFFADAAGTEDEEIDELSCGGLNIGGGASTVLEGPTPDGSTSRFTVSCSGNSCTLGATTTAGPGHQCTGTGCNFGTPLPIPNGGLTTCVGNTFAAPASGTLNLATGAMSANVSLSSRVILTGLQSQPCPICRVGSPSGAPCVGSPGSPCTGVCQGSPNEGSTCVSTNSEGLSSDCPIPAAAQGSNRCFGGANNGDVCTSSGNCPGGVCSTLVGTIPVDLTPLTTGNAFKSSGSGNFCPDQAIAGCFGDDECRSIRERGTPAGPLTVGTPSPITLASVFCIPSSQSILIDSSASLPGPGATALSGTITLVP